MIDKITNLIFAASFSLLTFSSLGKVLPSATAQADLPNIPSVSAPTATPRRLRINVAVSHPNDLKVKEGDLIQQGQMVADRATERRSLQNQKQQILLTKEQLTSSKILPPPEPEEVLPIQGLPMADFSQEEAAIAAAQMKLQQAQRMYEFALGSNPLSLEQANIDKSRAAWESKRRNRERQQEKLAAFNQIQGLPPEVNQHERGKVTALQWEEEQARAEFEFNSAKLNVAKENYQQRLKTLQNNMESAQASVNLSIARLNKARSDRLELEYQHSINIARRTEERNQAQQYYARQLQEYEQAKQNQQFRIAQVQEQLQGVEDRLITLASIKSPYSGTIRRIKQERQENGLLYIELLLVPSSGKYSETSL